MTDPHCAMPDDGSGSGPELARHLQDCTPCRGSLDVMSEQRDVIAYLGRPASPPGRPMVERVLSIAAEEGRRELGDLIYEMVRACLVLAEAQQERFAFNPVPAHVGDLANEVARIRRRVPDATVDEGTVHLVSRSSEALALQSAKACVQLLSTLCGETVQKRYIEATVHCASGEHSSAVAVLQPMLLERLPDKWWLGVRWTLTLALIRAGAHQEASKVAAEALATVPRDRMLLFNLATAYAHMGEQHGFDQICERFATSHDPVVPRDWWVNTVDEEASWFATQLGRDEASIRRSLTIPAEGAMS